MSDIYLSNYFQNLIFLKRLQYKISYNDNYIHLFWTELPLKQNSSLSKGMPSKPKQHRVATSRAYNFVGSQLVRMAICRPSLSLTRSQK